MSELGESAGEDGERKYFRSKAQQRDVYTFASGLGEYLAENSIENVVFIDRSARTACTAVDEYWNLTFSGHDKPGFFFVNPDGFDPLQVASAQVLGNPELRPVIKALRGRGASAESAREKMNALIQGRFKEVFKQLVAEKDKPLVLFDTCAHSGNTIESIQSILSDLGFTDVRIVTAHAPDKKAGIASAARLDKRLRAAVTCYPFGRDDLVGKGADVVSHGMPASEDPHEGPAIRRELRAIIRDGRK